MAVRRVRLRGPSEPSPVVFSEPDAGVERANSGRDLRLHRAWLARDRADIPGRGFRTSCSIAIATAQMASHGTTIGISRVGTRYSPQGRPHERRLGRSRPRRSRDHARARTVAVRTPSPKRSSHCGRTNKPYISTIARLKSGAVEVSSPVASSGEAAAAAVAAGLDRAFDFMMTGGGFPFRTRLGRETGMPRNRTGVRAVVAYGFSR